MSDPAKTPEEIEDVLASIRRLVSDHSPGPDGSMQPSEPSKAPVAEAAPATNAEDRLVLTSSFRVSEPDDPRLAVAGQEADAGTDDGHGEEPAAEVDTDSLVSNVLAEEVAAQDEPVTASADSDWQPDDRLSQYDTVGPDEGRDVSESDPEMEPEPVVPGDEVGVAVAADEPMEDDGSTEEDIADLIQLDGAAPDEADFESETGDENWPGDGAEAALLTLVARRDPATMPAEADEDGATTEDRQDVQTPDEDTAEPDLSTEDEDTEDAAPLDLDGETAPDAEGDEAATDEGPDSDTSGEQPVEDEDDVPVTPVFSRQRRTAEQARAHVENVEAEDLGEEPSPFTFPDSDEGILDEETLREIIVDVVREELQGVLGQRITRNVRKMVRREIRLALAAEDLD